MVIYNSWLAKKLLRYPLGTIMLFGFIFTKIKKSEAEKSLKINAVIKRHEVYAEQFFECCLLSLPIALIHMAIFSWLPVILLIPAMYYVIYTLNYCFTYIFCYRKYRHLPVPIAAYAKKYVAFELEADDYDLSWVNILYDTPTREKFGWVKYLSFLT